MILAHFSYAQIFYPLQERLYNASKLRYRAKSIGDMYYEILKFEGIISSKISKFSSRYIFCHYTAHRISSRRPKPHPKVFLVLGDYDGSYQNKKRVS